MKRTRKAIGLLLVLLTLSAWSAVFAAAAENKPNVPSISLTASNVEVTVRKTIQMTAETSNFTQTPEVTWTSNDESVATVDQNGTVKGIKAGRATITATAKAGEESAQGSMVIFVVKTQTQRRQMLAAGIRLRPVLRSGRAVHSA